MTDRERMIEVIVKRFAHLHDFECEDLADKLIEAGFGVVKANDFICLACDGLGYGSFGSCGICDGTGRNS